jgi:hypothetical protein
MSELVRDPVYREFLQTKPKVPKHLRDPAIMRTPPWVVYVQRKTGGKWGKKEFWKYSDAFKFFRAHLKAGAHDAAINNRRIGYEPPHRFVRIRGKYKVGTDGVKRQVKKLVWWKPNSALLADEQEHHWCRYCRRPTVFKYYSKHRVLGPCDPEVPRCTICGASVRIAIHHPSDRGFRVH